METAEKKSLFQDLWERRVFQYFGIYLGGSWAAIQFIEWLSGRYSFSPGWTDFALIFLALLIPSVLLLSYFHGRPGPDRWRKIEKIVIPLNLVLAMVFTVYTTNGKSLGATQQTVTVTDEEGIEVQRTVPKSTFLQRITFFPIDLSEVTDEMQWARFGVPIMLQSDLEQDNRMYGISALSLSDDFNRNGYNVLDETVPLSVKRKIAENNYTDLFVSGSLNSNSDPPEIQFQVHYSRDGKLLFEKNYPAKNLFSVIDEFTAEFKEQLYLKDVIFKEKALLDLPASDIYSSSPEAYSHYVNGRINNAINNKVEQAVSDYKKALEIDPKFVKAYSGLATAYRKLNKGTERDQALDSAIDMIERLPEREQFDIKFDYYLLKDIDKATRLLSMWMELYPEDYKPYREQIGLHRNTMQLKPALEVAKKAYEAGHRGSNLTTLADLASITENYDDAAKYLEEFYLDFPEKEKEDARLGGIYLLQGKFKKAEEFYDRLAILKPDDHEVKYSQAIVQGKLGNFEKELAIYDDAIASSKQFQDSMMVLMLKEFSLQKMGRYAECIELMRKRIKLNERVRTEFQAGMEVLSFNTVNRFYQIGRQEEVKSEIEAFLRKYDNSMINLRCVADLNYFLAVEDATAIDESMQRCDEFLTTSDVQSTRLLALSFLRHAEGSYAESADYMQQYVKATGTPAFMMAYYIGRALRKNGDFDEVRKLYEKTLHTQPDMAPVWFDYALLHESEGDMKEALNCLNKALKVWSNSDPEFEMANLAMQKRKEIQNNL